MEGDDEQDPLVDGARALLDGHVMLDRKLAVRSHYPPIAVLDSVSRLMPAVCSAPHLQKANELRRLLAAYTASEDLIRIGAYQKGSDPTLDKALALIPELHRFLMQKPGEAVSLADSITRLLALPG
jgi:flagellum-specific ATP synthase